MEDHKKEQKNKKKETGEVEKKDVKAEDKKRKVESPEKSDGASPVGKSKKKKAKVD